MGFLQVFLRVDTGVFVFVLVLLLFFFAFLVLIFLFVLLRVLNSLLCTSIIAPISFLLVRGCKFFLILCLILIWQCVFLFLLIILESLLSYQELHLHMFHCLKIFFPLIV